jgi:D-arabinose 1-dehydrogenase-like Zn-dependent alcohol dehydrogenase
VGPGQKVGIVGLGGLGHMGVKFAKAFGAHVVVFTTSPGKAADALGSARTRSSSPSNAAQMAAHAAVRLHPRHASPPITTSTPAQPAEASTAT